MSTGVIHKILIAGDYPVIHFTRDRDDDQCEQVIFPAKGSAQEPARPRFAQAIELMVPRLIEIMGLDDEVWGNARIAQITFKHTQDAIGLTATLKVSAHDDFFLRITTPYINTERVKSFRLATAIDQTIEEAWLYIKGARAQGNLFEEAEVEEWQQTNPPNQTPDSKPQQRKSRRSSKSTTSAGLSA